MLPLSISAKKNSIRKPYLFKKRTGAALNGINCHV